MLVVRSPQKRPLKHDWLVAIRLKGPVPAEDVHALGTLGAVGRLDQGQARMRLQTERGTLREAEEGLQERPQTCGRSCAGPSKHAPKDQGPSDAPRGGGCCGEYLQAF